MMWKTILVVALATVTGTLARTVKSTPACLTEDSIKATVASFIVCADKVVNVETILDEAKDTETLFSLYLLINKYNSKFPQLKPCVQELHTDLISGLKHFGANTVYSIIKDKLNNPYGE